MSDYEKLAARVKAWDNGVRCGHTSTRNLMFELLALAAPTEPLEPTTYLAASRDALNASGVAIRGLLAGSDRCGEYGAECPMQDAHKDWHDVQIALTLITAALAEGQKT